MTPVASRPRVQPTRATRSPRRGAHGREPTGRLDTGPAKAGVPIDLVELAPQHLDDVITGLDGPGSTMRVSRE
ncbi:hypothetical protein ACFXAE_09890 [Streptomyces sp. NPDC059454]|uniref:hypothetical protein n=1 Tax=Streptomyces sp. NPDC059454 TaxID=3346836 RepID=UPI0036CF8212